MVNNQIYMLSEEGIKVLAEKITEKITSSFKKKFASEEDVFLSIDEVAKFIKLTKPTVYGLVHQKNIPFHKKGKRLYFLKSEILNWIKEGKSKTKSDIRKDADSYLLNNPIF